MDVKLEPRTEVVAEVDGSDEFGRVVREFFEDGVPMVEIETDDPHWATGEYWMDVPRDRVQVLPPIV